ncbi:hypothetical protein DAPPUDRAFT_253942 [Daphnia pulex]|uniref:Uncharacterized protein n=1 Tax=Daphnia pulex TaxID=6669 RepID=E9H5Z9_DAPPU|nr:hypothetical protein DAPPUDRAFT_253942 [Daphnia pulex]|eukprot:EFX72811.1 hypothetical protein DAPPUDRAFT_253942 [Daphnia pulex]
MTMKKSDELEALKQDLKNKFEYFQQLSAKIKDELNAADTPPEDFETESDYIQDVEDDVRAAKVILNTKQKEWEIIKEDEERQKAADIERQKEEDRDKRLLHLLQQQQQQFQKLNTDNLQQVIAAIPAAVAPTVTVNAPAGVAQATRLPQRQIRHFKGDILEWTSFWESFNTAVHSSSLSTGEARLFVENLELTDANYQIAIDELQKTYGKKEVLISAHFEKLDSLQPVRDAKDVAALRNLQLTIQSHISALETLGKGKSTYGSLLGTKLIKLVPYKLQEKWSEVETNDSTDIDCVLKFIRDQTEAAERFGRLKVAEKPKQAQSNPQPKHAPPPATASQLATGARMNSANPVQEKQADLASFATKGTGHRNAQRI